MALLVQTVGGVVEGHLVATADGLVQRLDGEEELPVLRRSDRHGADVLHTGLEVAVGQALQLLHQLFALAVRDVLGEEERVDQQPQLPVGKVPHQIEVGPDKALLQFPGFLVGHHTDGFAILDLVAAVHQVENVAADGLAFHGHVVLGAQDLHDVLLAEPVVFIGVPPEDVQNVHDEHFLGMGRHVDHLTCIVPYLGIEYNAPWDKNIPWGVGAHRTDLVPVLIPQQFRNLFRIRQGVHLQHFC